MSPEQQFMLRALELAQMGVGSVSPNPLVGSVIVDQGQIIGEGWHHKWGGPHAEVNAIASIEDQERLSRSTLYVNLEPCSHFGKTPPCTDLIIGKGIKKVVIAVQDPNPLVSGMGIQKLIAAGVDVTSGVMNKEARLLNKRFFTFHEKERPYIILKWAETSDGFMAHANHESKWISNEFSRQCVHKWRTEEDAVLVGTRTAFHDNPRLNAREWMGRNPTRIVIDRFLRLSDKLHLFDQTQRTICYNVLRHEERENLLLIRLDEHLFIDQLVGDLYKRKIQSVIIEGGPQTLQFFIDLELWDEARIFTSPGCFKEGINSPQIRGRISEERMLFDDRLKIIERTEAFRT